VLGTSADSIDLAEDRLRFGSLMEEIGLPVPAHGVARTVGEAIDVARRIGFPVMVRPSYVLGGRAMMRVYDEEALRGYVANSALLDDTHPLFLDRFLEDAVEVDVDALCDGAEVWVAGVQQHIEMAGIHSGDSTSVLPPAGIGIPAFEEICAATRRIGIRLGAVGLLNIQFALRDDRAYVLEANPRASRTIPYVSKSIGIPLARLATRLLLGEKIGDLGLPESPSIPRFFVKMPVFPFRRFPQSDTILGPEMRSTGEVLGIGPDFGSAFAKACLGAGLDLPRAGTVFVSVNEHDKPRLPAVARRFTELGFRILATRGTAELLQAHGLPCTQVYKVNEGHPHVVDRIRAREVDLVVNTPLGRTSFYDERAIRSCALEQGIACITTIEGARAALEAIQSLQKQPLVIESLQEIHPARGAWNGGGAPEVGRAKAPAPIRQETPPVS
jgi:carbamoyl-phosphate synthase large subunit